MSLALSGILTSRFTFQPHPPEEFRKGFVDRLLDSTLRAKPGHATIDVSEVRGQQQHTRLAHAQSSDMDEAPHRTLSFDCCALCLVVELDGEHIMNFAS